MRKTVIAAVTTVSLILPNLAAARAPQADGTWASRVVPVQTDTASEQLARIGQLQRFREMLMRSARYSLRRLPFLIPIPGRDDRTARLAFETLQKQIDSNNRTIALVSRLIDLQFLELDRKLGQDAEIKRSVDELNGRLAEQAKQIEALKQELSKRMSLGGLKRDPVPQQIPTPTKRPGAIEWRGESPVFPKDR